MKRSTPPVALQVDVLLAQDNRCLYCGNVFGDFVRVPGRGLVILGLEWDHFIPYAYLVRNPDWNWVASCTLCNRLKSAAIFASVSDARAHVIRAWLRKGYRPAPISIAVLSDWLPGITQAPTDDDPREGGETRQHAPTATAPPMPTPPSVSPPRRRSRRGAPSSRRNQQQRQAAVDLLAAVHHVPVRRQILIHHLVTYGTSPGLARSVVDGTTRPRWFSRDGWLRMPTGWLA